MKNYSFSFLAIAALIGVFLGVGTASAADVVPTSKCVTATTEATHNAAVTQMNKDIAPYAIDAKVANVIEQYKQNIETAWQAMQQPYCGYGSYGTASAIHSLSKSIGRARSTFLTNIKNPSAANVALMQPTTVQVPSTAEEKVEVATASKETVKTTKTVKKASTTSVSTGTAIQKGLHRGMRSEAVTALQEKLAKQYGLATSDYVTGFFGAKTQQLVIKFQLEKGLISSSSSSAAGMIGPRTIKALSAI